MSKKLVLLLLLACSLLCGAARGQVVRTPCGSGQIVGDKPVGLWKYYEDDSLVLAINYDSSRVRYVRPDTARCKVWLDSAWQVKRLSRPPRLLGSRTAVIRAIQEKLRYPRADQAAGRVGNVVVACVVFEDGQVSKPFVELTNGPTLAAEVLRAVDEVPFKYLPGIYRGQRVRTKIQFAVAFRIQTSGKKGGEKYDGPDTIPVVYGGFNQIVVTALGAPRIERRSMKPSE